MKCWMDVDARISKAWRKRMLFLFFMIFGSGAWFLSDGYHFWPSEASRYSEFSEIKQGLVDEGKVDAEEKVEDTDNDYLRIAWEQHAREQGYRNKFPKERTDAAIGEQKLIGWTMLVGSVLFAAWVAWNHKLRVRAEGETIIGVKGERVAFDSIVKFDRKKWDNKGIMFAIYEVDGVQKVLTLDAHKFDGCESIIDEAERRLEARRGDTEEVEEAEEVEA